MSHVEKLPPLPLFLSPPRPLSEPTTTIKTVCRRTARQRLLDQLPGRSARCPAERVFLGGLSSVLSALCSLPGQSAVSQHSVGQTANSTHNIKSTMGSSRALICSTAFVLVLLSAASQGRYCCRDSSLLLLFSCCVLLLGWQPGSIFVRLSGCKCVCFPCRPSDSHPVSDSTLTSLF